MSDNNSQRASVQYITVSTEEYMGFKILVMNRFGIRVMINDAMPSTELSSEVPCMPIRGHV